MMWSTRIGHNLFVWRNGALVYKKWIGTRQPSRLFNSDVGWPDQEVR